MTTNLRSLYEDAADDRSPADRLQPVVEYLGAAVGWCSKQNLKETCKLDNDAAQQHWMEVMNAQCVLINMNERPAQFHEPPFAAFRALFPAQADTPAGCSDEFCAMTIPF